MNQRTIAIVGENLVDLFVEDDGTVTPVPGGGPFNVARTVSRLGQHAVLFSGISKDEFGQTLQEVLNADGVSPRTSHYPLDLPTSLAIVEVDGAGPRSSST